jgi:hypothetical protein
MAFARSVLNSSAGSGGIGGGSLTSGGAGTPGSSGAGGAARGDSTCERACRNARACLTSGPLCPDGDPADGAAIEAGCLQMCALTSEDFEAIAEDASRCGQALRVLVEGSERASGESREAIERCAPSESCHLGCDAIGFCAVNACENLGVNGGNVYGACIPRCAADEEWGGAFFELRNTRGCVAALTRYVEDAPGDLPAGCPPQ